MLTAAVPLRRTPVHSVLVAEVMSPGSVTTDQTDKPAEYAGQPGQTLVPPSTGIAAPVMKLLSALQSQVTTRATSSGCPARPIGMRPKR
jgi:hypothetical protein